MGGKDETKKGSMLMPVLSCTAYSIMSNFMVLGNRYLFGKSYFGFEEKIFGIVVQAIIAVGVLEIANARKIVEYEPFSMEVAKKWAPVTVFFVFMLYTSTLATAGLPIHIITVFKNVTNIAIVFGEWKFFGEKASGMVIGSLCVMLVGAVMASYSDVDRHSKSTLSGYFWILMNCGCTASYVLYMRYATSRSSLKISKFGMAFYNNLLSIVLLLPMMVMNGEVFTVFSNPLLQNFSFLLLLFLTGLMGIGLNLASFWCVSVTSATTYATVGALNKLPTTFIGVFLLGEELKPTTAIYVTFGMIGGIMYGYAKFKEQQAVKKAPTRASHVAEEEEMLSKA